MLSIGSKAGSYEIISILDSGEEGILYLARDFAKESDEALLSPVARQDSALFEKLKQEFLSGAHTSESKRVYSIFEAEGNFYLVLKYSPGMNLSSLESNASTPRKPIKVVRVAKPNPAAEPVPDAIPEPETHASSTEAKPDPPQANTAPAKPKAKARFLVPLLIVAALVVVVLVVTVGRNFAHMLPSGLRKLTGYVEESSISDQDFSYVEGGTFMMGSSNSSEADERPVHQVTVGSFYLAKAELTQAEWDALMPINPSRYRGPDLPIHNLSWFDAIDYCNRRSRAENLKPVYSINGEDNPPHWSGGYVEVDQEANGYRLPTEAEWEFASRGGNSSGGYTFIGSNQANQVSWHSGNSNGMPHPVKQLQPNELGLYDMGGNASEYCLDWYANNFYSMSNATNPVNNTASQDKVLRGGSWKYGARFSKATNRSYDFPWKSSLTNGMRLCRTR
ncbi:MAG: SUMF1/EgtB/PvdO family nonheme iron enzyme [Candidatus Cloacimonadota bacterium]